MVGRVEAESIKYLGFQINQENDKIIYISYRLFPLSEKLNYGSRKSQTKTGYILSIEEQTLFRKLVGQLNWVEQT